MDKIGQQRTLWPHLKAPFWDILKCS